MEDRQINEAMKEYDATCEDSQPVIAREVSTYDLAAAIEPSEWRHDFAEYLMGPDDASLLTLLAYIRVALSYESEGGKGQAMADEQLGRMVRRNFTRYIRDVREADNV